MTKIQKIFKEKFLKICSLRADFSKIKDSVESYIDGQLRFVNTKFKSMGTISIDVSKYLADLFCQYELEKNLTHIKVEKSLFKVTRYDKFKKETLTSVVGFSINRYGHVSYHNLSGVHLQEEDFALLLGQVKWLKSYLDLGHILNLNRTWKHSTVTREGSSGSKKRFVESYKPFRDSNGETVFVSPRHFGEFQVSMFQKVKDFDLWLGDAALVLPTPQHGTDKDFRVEEISPMDVNIGEKAYSVYASKKIFPFAWEEDSELESEIIKTKNEVDSEEKYESISNEVIEEEK